MAEYEMCEIDYRYVRETKHRARRSLKDILIMEQIYTDYTVSVYRWEARRTTASGSVTIYESVELEEHSHRASCLPNYRQIVEEERRRDNQAYQQMLAHLAAEGWEPAVTNAGRVTLMKRRVDAPDDQPSTKFGDLLQQLKTLRDAGILTEEEFQAKKAEVLKRI